MGTSPSTARRARTALLAMLAATATLAQAEGLALHAQEGVAGSTSGSKYALTSIHASGNSIRLFSDYYFFDPAHGDAGPAANAPVDGFRASTGLVGLAQPLSLFEARPDPLQSLPYIGLGYSHLWLKSQWSVNADFGLASQNHGHGLFTSASSLDDDASQLRWAPVMAVNVRYAF